MMSHIHCHLQLDVKLQYDFPNNTHQTLRVTVELFPADNIL